MKFDTGKSLIWNASPSLANNNVEGATVFFKERTGANTAIVEKGSVEFEVFLDELENPEEF
tara:strand:- start:183 stop:365 length:183 start_codon:yes stop_codon:yes gene_type:complete